MQRFAYLVPILIFGFAALVLLYGYFHPVTKVESKVSEIKIEPYYTAHKDSTHFALTFRVNNYTNKLGIYIGSQADVETSPIIGQVDTSKLYTILFDETVPAVYNINLGIREMSANGKRIYKDNRLIALISGICCLLIATWLVVNEIKKEKANPVVQ